MKSNHYTELKKYNKSGICSLPVKIKDKYPSMLSGWKEYEAKFPSEEQINNVFSPYWDVDKFGCCMICGKISGGLLVIDFDNHCENAEQIFNDYTNIDEVQTIIKKYDLPIETTPSGGYHIFLRVEMAPGNMELAKQYDQNEAVKTVIETRGQGGLVVCSPTKGYEVVSGDLYDIKQITEEELNTLFDYAKSFNEVEENKQPAKQTIQTDESGDRPGDIYNEKTDITALLQGYGWTNIRGGKLWRRPGKDHGASGTLGYVAPGVFYNFSGNAYPLEEKKAYTAFTLYAAYEHNNDLSAAARQIKKDLGLSSNTPEKKTPKHSGQYGNRTKPKPPRTTPTESDQPETDSPSDPGIIIETRTAANFDIIFWGLTDRGAVVINYKELKRFLIQEGFFKYRINKDSLMLVKITGNIVEEYNEDMIYDYVRKYIDYMDEDGGIYNKIRKNKSMLNAEDLSRELETIDILFVKDTREFTYVFYRNTAVKVSASGYSLLRYDDLPGKVWKKQIIDREFKEMTEDDAEECDAKRLINKMCGDNRERVLAYMTATGYLINRYKTQEECPVIDWGDEEMHEGESHGGTGKGLSIKMVRKIRNVVTIDGKSFDTTKSFTFSRVDPDTDIINIDDIDKKYDIEKLFSLVTEGLIIEKKYQNEIYIDFPDAPKWTLTRNHPLPGYGDSFNRRLFSIEIHPFLSAKHTPSDFLGRSMFAWDDQEWQRFDNFMMRCAQLFLMYGLQRPTYINLEINRLKANTRPGFVEWADTALKNGEPLNKKDLREQYSEETGDSKISQTWFNKCLQRYCDFHDYNYDIHAGGGKANLFIYGKVE